MFDNLKISLEAFYQENIIGYINDLYLYPVKLITLLLDLSIVLFLAYQFIKTTKNTRVWQLVKGIILLIVITAVSAILNLRILNFLLTSLMTYGVIVIIVIFQPELRRGLEQLGTNKLTKYFGMEKDLATKTKEAIYKIIIATTELAKLKTGGLIVIERDIKLADIVETGLEMDAEISPQLLVNIFVPNTPLHDGAVIISNNKIQAAACILPLASDKDIAKELGTRHRAAIGISKESDAIAVVVSEETGKISVAKDGTLIADVTEDALKKILIKSIVTNRLDTQETHHVRSLRNKIQKKHQKQRKAENESDKEKEDKPEETKDRP